MRSIYYPIELAPDFDMQRIELRVPLGSPAFERLEGLAIKAFLVQSVARGARTNRYAPFYIWHDDVAISRFLAGPLFGRVIESFGRPGVIDRRVLEFDVADGGMTAALATFQAVAADRSEQPEALWQAESRAHREVLRQPGLVAACALLDGGSWTITRVRLWDGEGAAAQAGAGAERFDVLRAVGPALAGVNLASAA